MTYHRASKEASLRESGLLSPASEEVTLPYADADSLFEPGTRAARKKDTKGKDDVFELFHETYRSPAAPPQERQTIFYKHPRSDKYVVDRRIVQLIAQGVQAQYEIVHFEASLENGLEQMIGDHYCKLPDDEKSQRQVSSRIHMMFANFASKIAPAYTEFLVADRQSWTTPVQALLMQNFFLKPSDVGEFLTVLKNDMLEALNIGRWIGGRWGYVVARDRALVMVFLPESSDSDLGLLPVTPAVVQDHP